MSGVAIFGAKHRSLLDFDECKEGKVVWHNLKTLYGVDEAQSDTQLIAHLDNVEPNTLSRAFKSYFRAAQRGKFL